MNELFKKFWISPEITAAGFAGGIAYALYLIQSGSEMPLKRLVARVFMGALIANYTGQYVSSLLNLSEAVAGFVIGVAGESLIVYLLKIIKTKLNDKSKK
jgi:hypothetical protein